jgi:hypothetical protein
MGRETETASTRSHDQFELGARNSGNFIEVLEDYAKTSYPGHRLGDLTRAVPRPANAVMSHL